MQKVSITRLNSLFIFGYTILIYLCSLSHVTSEASRNLSIRAQQQRCANQLDLMFVLDMSGSIGPHRWVNKVRPFVHRFVDSLSVSEKEVNIALMLYDDTTSIEWDFLDKKYDKKKILDDIDNLRYNGGGTYTWIALKKARDEVLFKVRDERKKVPKLIVLITDGVTNDREITDFASSIQKRGASIYVLGIQGAAQEQCRKMAGCPPYGDCKNFSFQNWDELLSNSKNFLAQVCETLPQDAECQSGVRHGNCSKECGGGERTVTYFYYQTQPPIAGSNGQKGKSCAELYQERTATETCNNMACTENAKCNEMGPFSDCSTTCGDGTKTRNRLEPLTLKPAVNGHKGPGQTCEEQGYQLTEVVPCKEKECPINELLSDWVDGKCNADCGPGLKKRSRSTLIPAQFSGKTAAEQGLATEKILRCEIKTCGGECTVKEWTEFSKCSAPTNGLKCRHSAVITFNSNDPCNEKHFQCEKCNTVSEISNAEPEPKKSTGGGKNAAAIGGGVALGAFLLAAAGGGAYYLTSKGTGAGAEAAEYFDKSEATGAETGEVEEESMAIDADSDFWNST